MNDELVGQLRDVPLLRGVNEAWWRHHAGDLRELHFATGDCVVAEGDQATEAYVILSGALDPLYTEGDHPGLRLPRLGPGELVGEIGVMTGGRRTATLRAAEPTRLVAIAGSGFRALLAEHPPIVSAITVAASERLRRTRLVDQMAHVLGGGEARDAVERRDDVDALLDWVHLRAGEVLFEEGAAGDHAYVVMAGRLRAVAGPPDERVVLNEVARGEMVGEMALIEDEPRSATVFATRDSQLVRIARPAFEALLEGSPQLTMQVARTMVQRQRRRARKRHDEYLSVVVAPAADGADTATVAADLVAELRRFGATEHLTSTGVDERLGVRDISQSREDEMPSIRLVPWLHQLEDQCRFVVYETDPKPTRWNERALTHADHVLFVAAAEDRPVAGVVRRQVQNLLRDRIRPHQTLVLAHPATAALPSGTDRWLADDALEAVVHLRSGERADAARLARLLAGQSVSLVLGGGASRGFAHLGVLRALEELEVPVDYVAGTSIGAAMATLPAMRVPTEEQLELVTRRFTKLMDFTLPVVSLLAGRRVTRAICGQYGDTTIEDLWLPYFCVSTSLTRARPTVHERGSLATAVRASIAIPGVFPPVVEQGELLVDGSVLDNLPVGEMRRRNPQGSVVAVDVAPPTSKETRATLGPELSGFTALWRRLRGEHVPLISATVLRSVLVASVRDRDAVVEEGHADLVLGIDPQGIGPFEFGNVEPVARVGYDTARAALESWLEEHGEPWRR